MAAPQQVAIPSGLAGRRGIQLATLIVFVAFLDFFAGLPLVPTYARELGAAESLVGVIVAAYSITNLPGNVVAGYFLDRFGRRLPITVGLVVTALALAGYAAATSAEVLLAVRGLHGLAAAVLTPGAFAMLGDSSQTGSRGRTMGRSAVVIAIAAVLGPASAGILQGILGYETVFLMMAGLMAITAVIYIVVSRDTRVSDAVEADKGAEAQPSEVMAETPFRVNWLVLASIVAIAWTVGIGTLTTYLPLHVEDLGEAARTSGNAFTLFALTALIMMVGVIGIIGDRFGRLTFLSVGLALFSSGLFLMAATQELWAVYAGMAVIGFGFGLLLPTATALVADASGPVRRGLAFGIFYGAYSLGITIGDVVSGVIADVATTAPTGWPYAVAGIVAAATILFTLAAMTRGIGSLRGQATA